MEQTSHDNRYNTIGTNPLGSTSHLCWRSILSGVLVSLFAYIILSALGAGVGGWTVAHILEKNENGSGFFAGAGVWLGLAAVISLFLGSYFGTRFSVTTHKQIGAAQGIVTAALFFFVVLHGSGSVVGNLSAFANQLAGSPTSSDAEEAARVAGDAGWILFVATFFGLIAAIIGGVEGALGNRLRPFVSATASSGK